MLRDYQENTIVAVREGFRTSGKRQMVMLPTGAGKCLARGTRILMADGSTKKVEDVAAGDRLMGPDGKGRNVLSLARGKDRLYRITPTKGEPYTVNSVHLLSLKFTNCGHRIILADGQVLTPSDKPVFVEAATLYKSSKTAKHVLKGWRPDGVDFEDEVVFHKIPPYILGLWLGDGTAIQPSISKPSGKVVDEWTTYAEAIGCSVSMHDSGGTRCPTWRIVEPRSGRRSVFHEELCRLGLLGNKHIPREYIFATRSARLALLAGLLDTDGHLSNNGYDIVQKSESIARDVVFLCKSVGLHAGAAKCTKHIKELDFTGEYWRVSISGDCSIIPCQQKKADPRGQKKRVNVFGIKIEYVGFGDYYGFEIDGDRQFLLGDWQVTHNTHIASYMIAQAAAKGLRCGFVCDRLELIDQTSRRFFADGIDHGIIQADNPLWSPDKIVQVCSVQTLARRKVEPFDLVVIDEAHTLHSAHIRMMGDAYVVGLSATPFTKGLGKHFNNLVSPVSTRYLIDAGYLSDFEAYGPASIDVSGIKTVAGDYDQQEVGKRIDQPHLVADVVRTWLKLARGHKTICFATNIGHSRHLVNQFLRNGVQAEHLDCYTGKSADDETTRKEVIERFKAGETTVLCNVDILTKGFDDPDVACIIQARPTKSLMIHIQQIGRGLRYSDGKTCIILDHAGNHARLGFADGELPTVLDDGQRGKNSTKKKEREEPLPKPCKSCDFLKPAGVRKCPACGFLPQYVEQVETEEGELEKIRKGNRKEYSMEEKQAFLAGLNQWCIGKGWKPGRGGCFGVALRIYKDKFGTEPPSALDWGAVAPMSQDVKNWLKHAAIRRNHRRQP